MSEADDMTVNWEPYEAEILSLYVDQNQTLTATMTHMRDKYGLRATEKQYKAKFSGYKNLKASEWALIAQNVRKRTLEGKDSDIYLYGKRLEPKRVKTNTGHYQSRIPDRDSNSVIGTSSRDRIYIRTPPAASASACASQADVAQHVSLNDFFLDMTVDIDMDFTSQLYQSSSPIFTEMSPRLRRNISEDTSPQHVSMIETSPFHENFDFDMSCYINMEFGLTRNLPWFQLQTLMEQSGFMSISPVINEIFQTSFPLSSPFSLFNHNETNLALNERHGLLSGLLRLSSKSQVGDYIPNFTTNLQRLIPERQEGELSVKVHQLFDPSNKHPLYQLFEFATYFSSNNMLTESQTDVFLKWIIDQKHVDLLKSFLQIKTPAVQAFSTRILESGIRIKDIKFLQFLILSGFKFDIVLEQAIKIEDHQFLTLLLQSGVDSSLLSGISGGRLLHGIAKTPYTGIAHILIQNGADVNLLIGEDIYETSLYRAVQYSTIDMVRCLLDAGASVDTYCKHRPYSALGRAACDGKRDVVVVLLEKGADVDSCLIYRENILEWSALNNWGVYQVLLERTEKSDRRVTIGDIIYAAERGSQAFSNFRRHHEARVSQYQLEKALSQSLNYSKFRATEVLLGSGVDPNGSTLNDDDRPLMGAAILNGIKYSQLLINAGANVNLPDLLRLAVEQDNFELLSCLIDSGADLEMYGPEALEEAAENNNVEMAALLLDKGTAINAYGKVLTSLQAAARFGNIELAQYLIGRGADVNAPASLVEGRTALQAAAAAGRVKMTTFLLAEHANVNAPPALADGLTALEAVMSGYKSKETKATIFKLLVDHGASINRPGGQGYRTTTILHDLIQQDQEDLIRLAVEAGVDVNHMSSGKEGKTPLQLAAGKGNLGVVKLLLEAGAEVNAPPGYKYGRTALQAAASCPTPNIELVQLLIDNHANVNAMAGVMGGITALQGSAICGHIKIALLLLQRGADVNARPAIKDGRTAIEGAAEHGRLDMVQLLLNADAKGDITGKTGFKKAIEYAEKNRHFSISQLLKAHQST